MLKGTMTTETPAQRRTRLIEQYAGQLLRQVDRKAVWHPAGILFAASDIADAVIAATPQPEPTRYPSEIETRLIQLVEYCIDGICGNLRSETARNQLAAIKRDLGIV